MNKTIFKLSEIAYAIMAILSVYVIITNWNTNRDKANLFILFLVVSIFMLFFKRRFRKRFEKRDKDR